MRRSFAKHDSFLGFQFSPVSIDLGSDQHSTHHSSGSSCVAFSHVGKLCGGGPNQGGHLAGDRALLTSERLRRQLARNTGFVDAYSYSITSALVGVAILCLFLFHPSEDEFLWFSLILLVPNRGARIRR